MNPNQALDILNSLCAQMALNRAQHVEVQQAVATIRDALTEKADQEPAE